MFELSFGALLSPLSANPPFTSTLPLDMSKAKRGFFGRQMLMATNQKCNLQIAGMRRSVVLGGSTASVVNERRLSFSGMIASNNRVNHIVRSIYFLNALIILVGLGYITQNQRMGRYRPSAIKILFDEVILEDANVLLDEAV